MVVTLTKKQYDFLHDHLKEDNLMLFEKFELQRDGSQFLIDDDIAIAIRDWAGEKLQTDGFDENYEPNEMGAMLEDLIDVFYS